MTNAAPALTKDTNHETIVACRTVHRRRVVSGYRLSLPLTAQALDRVASFESQAVVAAMIEQVQPSQVYSYDAH